MNTFTAKNRYSVVPTSLLNKDVGFGYQEKKYFEFEYEAKDYARDMAEALNTLYNIQEVSFQIIEETVYTFEG